VTHNEVFQLYILLTTEQFQRAFEQIVMFLSAQPQIRIKMCHINLPCEQHRMLIMDVVIGHSMVQHPLFTPQIFNPISKIHADFNYTIVMTMAKCKIALSD
jgi:hypothetical protein